MKHAQANFFCKLNVDKISYIKPFKDQIKVIEADFNKILTPLNETSVEKLATMAMKGLLFAGSGSNLSNLLD